MRRLCRQRKHVDRRPPPRSSPQIPCPGAIEAAEKLAMVATVRTVRIVGVA